MRVPKVSLIFVLAFAPLWGASDLPPEANRLQPDHSPTPFSAEAIREASPAGHTIRHVVEVTGQPAIRSVTVFLEGDMETARFRFYNEDAAGNRLGEPQVGEAKWLDLQRHASFPAEHTSIASASVTLAAGSFECWLYTVTGEAAEQTTESRFWFAQDLPGPPVKMVQSRDGEVVMTMTLEAPATE